ncbi:hypothetical protein OROMI_033030 [Orobanche minor]
MLARQAGLTRSQMEIVPTPLQEFLRSSNGASFITHVTPVKRVNPETRINRRVYFIDATCVMELHKEHHWNFLEILSCVQGSQPHDQHAPMYIVSNWFINARVRLWKPMVEEMYKEETGDADMDSNSSSEKTNNTKDNKVEDSHQATTSTGQHQLIESKRDRITDIDIMGSDNISIFHNDYGIGKIREGQNSLFPDENTVVCQSERFMSAAYHISELERFGNVDLPVSLTLGLQQCEGDRLSMADSANHGFNPLREGVVYSNAASAMANETADFDCMDSGNRQHQFQNAGVALLLSDCSRA